MYKSRFEDGGEIGDYYKTQTDTSISDGDDYNFPVGSGLFDTAGNINLENIGALTTDSELFKAFQAAFPEDAALLKDLMGGDYGFAPVGADNPTGQELVGPDPAASDISVNDAETKKLARQAGTDPNQDPSLKATGVPVGDPNDPMGTKKLGIDNTKPDNTKPDKTGLETLPDYLKYLAMLAAAKMTYDDAQRAREEAQGWSSPGGYAKQAVRSPGGGVTFKPAGKAAGGGIGSLDMTTKQPFYLGGVTDGMADKIPAHIDNKRPAALSDGEFVIPADVVSHLGNGNSNAGAKRLYEMMDNIREARTGNKNQGIQINPNNFMPG